MKLWHRLRNLLEFIIKGYSRVGGSAPLSITLTFIQALAGTFYALISGLAIRSIANFDGVRAEQFFTQLSALFFIALFGRLVISLAAMGNNAIRTRGMRLYRDDAVHTILHGAASHVLKSDPGVWTVNTIPNIFSASQIIGFPVREAATLVLGTSVNLAVTATVSWELALFSFLSGVTALLLGCWYVPRMLNQQRRSLLAKERANSRMSDIVRGFQVIKIFGLEERGVSRYATEAAEQRDAGNALGTVTSYRTIQDVLTNFALIMITLGFGGVLVSRGWISMGDVLFCLMLCTGTSNNIARSAMTFTLWMSIAEQSKRVEEVLDFPMERGGEVCVMRSAAILFDDISFRYGDESDWALRHLNLRIEAGKRVALVGESGGGKTTILRLILGLYMPEEGKLIIGENDVTEWNISSLRRHIAYVPQFPVLFSGTVRENIVCGNPNIVESELVRAAELANIHSFIETLPLGYDTDVGEGGVQFSGGQRQRIALAAAFLRNVPILLLDESTSSLDGESEALIYEEIQSWSKGRTLVLNAHRLSTARFADSIVVVEHGGIVEQGEHERLLQMGGVYRSLWDDQYYNESLEGDQK